MRNKTLLILLSLLTVLSSYAQTPAFQASDYQKALWMTTRFYGAQRMGKNCNNWLLYDYQGNSLPSEYLHGDSYIKDADGDYDLSGGWFDCGDFVLFGQTFYYSEYALLLAYSEFADGHGDYYSQDYNEYTSKGKYKWEDSRSGNGIPDILDECKWATDFTMKAVRDANTFYYQKGDGNADHPIWMTSPTKSATKSTGEGGETNGSRQVLKASGNVTDMASLAGASLAVMARVYADIDAEYAQKCKEKAIVAYNFVKNTSKGSTGAPGFYDPKNVTAPDETILYAELYRLTGDEKYKTDMESIASQWIEWSWNHYWIFGYAKSHDAAAYLLATIPNKYQQAGKNALKGLVDKYKEKAVDYRFDDGDYSWGYLRYIASQAFVAALENKVNDNDENDKYIYATIDYIMGHNSGNFSYIVGFGDKYPTFPHHRNVYLNDDNNEDILKPVTSSYPYAELGYLAGGTNNGTYNDNVKQYWCSEGGIDYNAGLVGALGYITSKASPAKEVAKIEMSKQPSVTTYTIGDKINLNNAQIKVTYTDNSIEYLAVTESMISGFSSDKVADKLTITVTLDNKTTTFYVKVEKRPTGIKLVETPKTDYIRSEKINIEGGKIRYEYNDGSYEEHTLTLAMVSGFSSATTGKKTITVTYEGYKTSYDIVVNEPPIIDIHISPAPTKKIYQVNEELDLAGGKIEIYYQLNDSEIKDITEDMVSGFSSDKAGTYTITVSYGGFQETYKITVEKKPTKLSITSMPKTSYVIADLLDVSGGRLRYEYNDGTFDELDMDPDMVSGFINSAAGKLTLTVTHEGLSTKYDVTFTKAAISKIEISQMPDKTTYQQGEELSVAGGKLKIYYANDTDETIDLTADMVSGFDSNTAGSKSLNVSYINHQTTFSVTIEKAPDPVVPEPKPEDPEPEDPDTPELPTAAGDISIAPAHIYSYGHTIFVEDFDGLVEVFSTGGSKVFSGTNVSEIAIQQPGIYLVKTLGASKKVAIFN